MFYDYSLFGVADIINNVNAIKQQCIYSTLFNKIKLREIMQIDLFSDINGSFYVIKSVFHPFHKFTNDKFTNDVIFQ